MPQSKHAPALCWLAGSLTVAAVAALALFPLYNDFSYTHITLAKWQGALGLGAVCLACAITALIACAFTGGRRYLRWHPVCWMGVGFFALVALSAWLGPMGHRLNDSGQWVWWVGATRHEGLAAKLLYGGIFLCMSLYPPRWRGTLTAAGTALMLFCGVVAWQYMGGNPLGLFPEGRSIYTNYEFQGTIGNIDMVSGYLSLVVPMLLAGFLLLSGWTRGWMLAAGTLGVLLLLCMEVQSGLIVLGALLVWVAGYGLCHPECRRGSLWMLSLACLCAALRTALRMPWLDGTETLTLMWSGMVLRLLLVAVLLGVSAETWGRTTRFALRPRTLVVAVAMLLAVALLALALVDLPASMGGLYELSEILHGRPQDSFGSYRLGVWRNSLIIARQHLFTGTGPNTFLFAMQEQLAAAGLVYPETFDSAHNGYVTILVENGLPALVMYVAFLGTMLLLGVRRAKRRPWLWVTTLAIGCYAIQDFFSFSICLVSPMFWAVLGMHAAELARSVSRRICRKRTKEETVC